jgi:hypothetical protein
MTNKKSGIKTAKKSTIKTKSSTTEKETLDAKLNTGKMTLSDYAQSTKEELIKLGDKIHEATDKGIHVAHDIAEDVHKFAKNASELTKLKIDLHNLKEEKQKLYALMGEQLRNLYKTDKLSRIKSRMKSDFIRLDELESLITEKEKLASKISLSK